MTDIDTQKTDEAEIDLLDLFLVLLKYKWFILLATILPTVVIGLILSKLPKDYKTSYTYKVEINDTELRVLQDIFYSKENLQKLTKKIQSCELKNIIPNLTTGTLKQSVRFEILPSLFYTNTRTFDELLEQKNAKGAYLLLQICHESKEVLQKIAPVYRENFEKVIPLYAEKNRLIYGEMDATSKFSKYSQKLNCIFS